ncbi:MAG: hypothetical protein R3A47_06055 [Polyangiales bacterium]
MSTRLLLGCILSLGLVACGAQTPSTNTAESVQTSVEDAVENSATNEVESGTTDSQTNEDAVPTDETSASDASNKVETELLDAGRGAKRELRLQVHPGDQFQTTMRMDMQMKMSVNGNAPPEVVLPVAKLSMIGVVGELDGQRCFYSRSHDRRRNR